MPSNAAAMPSLSPFPMESSNFFQSSRIALKGERVRIASSSRLMASWYSLTFLGSHADVLTSRACLSSSSMDGSAILSRSPNILSHMPVSLSSSRDNSDRAFFLPLAASAIAALMASLFFSVRWDIKKATSSVYFRSISSRRAA